VPTTQRNPLIGVLNLIDPRRDWPDTLDNDGIAALNTAAGELLGALRRHFERATPADLARPWNDNPGITAEIRYALALAVGTRYALGALDTIGERFTPAAQALQAVMVAGFAWRDALVDPAVEGQLTVTSDYDDLIHDAARWSKAPVDQPNLNRLAILLRATRWTSHRGDDPSTHRFTRPWTNGPLDEKVRPTEVDTLEVTTPEFPWLIDRFTLNGIDYTWPELVQVMTSGRDAPRADGQRPCT
jgi:hypothetical protein